MSKKKKKDVSEQSLAVVVMGLQCWRWQFAFKKTKQNITYCVLDRSCGFFPEPELMAPLITGVFERLRHRTGLSGTVSAASEITAPADSFPSLMTAFNLLSVSRRAPACRGVMSLLVTAAGREGWTGTGLAHRDLRGRRQELKQVVYDTWWRVRPFGGGAGHLGTVLIKTGRAPDNILLQDHEDREDESRGSGTQPNAGPLIKVWELNQTTRHSYLPIQQLFDSSVGDAARPRWRAAWLSLPKVALRGRDKLKRHITMHLKYTQTASALLECFAHNCQDLQWAH